MGWSVESGGMGNFDTKELFVDDYHALKMPGGELQDERFSVILIGDGMIFQMSTDSQLGGRANFVQAPNFSSNIV